jgi:hypothetical protein
MSSLYRRPSIVVPTKFRFIWQSGFRGEYFIKKSEIRMACGGHVCEQMGKKLAIFIDDLPHKLLTKLRFIWPSGFRGEEFLKSANQKQ